MKNDQHFDNSYNPSVSMWPYMVFFVILSALLWRAPGLDFYLGSSDHGFQLSLGRQIVLGKFPFVDFFPHYGPLVAFTSGLGIWIWDSLIAETVICATGYALAIFLIYRLTGLYVSNLAGIPTASLGFLLLARYYKWYYWLFPMLALYCFHRVLKHGKSNAVSPLFWSGVLDGIAALYRLDLGIACACFHLICYSWFAGPESGFRKSAGRFGFFILGACLPLLTWLSVLYFKVGSWGIRDFFVASLAGARWTVEEFGLPMPFFNLAEPFSDVSRSSAAFLAVAITYIVAVWQGSRTIYSGAAENVNKAKFTLAVCILGLGLMPQALQRPDVHHLLQVLPPALIAGAIVTSNLWGQRKPADQMPLKSWLPKSLALAYVAFAALTVWGIRGYGGFDLASWHSFPFDRYRGLVEGTTGRGPHVVPSLVSAIRRLTSSDDCLLVAGNMPQLYFFAKRPVGGLLTFYGPGVIADIERRQRDLELIKKNRPIVLVAPGNFCKLSKTNYFRRSRPELYDFLRKQYPQVIYEKDSWAILVGNDDGKSDGGRTTKSSQ